MKRSLRVSIYVLKYCYFFLCFLLLCTININAYVDPSVMTYAIQAIAGIAIAVGTVASVYWRKISKALFGKTNAQFTEYEADTLEFHDPATGETRVLTVTSETETTKKKSGENSFLPSVFLSLAISFMLCFYSPLEVYFTNIEEFQYDIYAIIGHVTLLFLAVFVGLFILYFLTFKLSKKLYYLALVLGFIAFIAMYIQGNYLINTLPAGDGSPVDWSLYGNEMRQSLVLWAGTLMFVSVLAILLRKKWFPRIVKYTSILITGILAITLLTLGIHNHGFARKQQVCISNHNITAYSNDKNFIILIVDAVDSGTFQEILETTDPQYADVLKDFTYYPDTLGSYPHTQLGVPQLLTGAWYECKEDYRIYFTNAMRDSELFQTLKQKNYISGIYDMDLVYDDPAVYEFENITNTPFRFKKPMDFILDELRLSFFLYMPYQLKKYEPYAVYNIKNEAPSGDFFYWYNNEYYTYIQEHPIEVVAEKRFKEIHIEGGHVPFKYNRDVQFIGNDAGSYEDNIRATMTIIEYLLEDLKANNVYNNTAIVILADHGFENRNTVEGRQNPLLLVKGVKESHDFKISDTPLSYSDLPLIYKNLLNDASDTEIVAGIESDKVRRYIEYTVYKPEHLKEYELKSGQASDYSALSPTGNYYNYQDK